MFSLKFSRKVIRKLFYSSVHPVLEQVETKDCFVLTVQRLFFRLFLNCDTNSITFIHMITMYDVLSHRATYRNHRIDLVTQSNLPRP